MITQIEAERIATDIMGTRADDPDNGWTIREFSAGWLVLEKLDEDDPLIGAGSYVIERDSGRMLHFPSYVPPGRILREYSEVAAKGYAATPRYPAN
jgi:hypothetical protein